MVYLFQAGVPFPQRTRNGLFLGEFIQRIKHQVRQRKHQVRQTKNHEVRQTKYMVRQTKHQVCNLNQKSTPKNTNLPETDKICNIRFKVCQNIDLRCFDARQFFSQIYALFGVPFTGLKIWWRTKNDKYEVCLRV